MRGRRMVGYERIQDSLYIQRYRIETISMHSSNHASNLGSSGADMIKLLGLAIFYSMTPITHCNYMNRK